MDKQQVDIIIPILNQLSLTRTCLESIKNKTDIPYRFILIDNGSDDQTKKFLEDFRRDEDKTVLVRNPKNLGWVRAVNQGIELSDKRYVCIMNNDTVVKTKGWLSKLIAVSNLAEDIGLVNPCFTSGRNITAGPFTEVDFCRGYCVLIKRGVIEKIGGLDESYGLGYYDDDDYSVRAIRANFRCVRANDVLVEHLRDSTFSDLFKDASKRMALHEKNKGLFYSKWGRRLRLVLVLTKKNDIEKISDILFSLARRQHIIYFWNFQKPLRPGHINIREKVFPPPFFGPIASFHLFLNRFKKASGRYDAVFVDDPRLNRILSRIEKKTYYIDTEKDDDQIMAIADSLSRA